MSRLVRSAWSRWRILAEGVAHAQAIFVFALLYLLLVGPFAIGVQLFLDPLKLRGSRARSTWSPLARQTHTIEDARRQF